MKKILLFVLTSVLMLSGGIFAAFNNSADFDVAEASGELRGVEVGDVLNVVDFVSNFNWLVDAYVLPRTEDQHKILTFTDNTYIYSVFTSNKYNIYFSDVPTMLFNGSSWSNGGEFNFAGRVVKEINSFFAHGIILVPGPRVSPSLIPSGYRLLTSGDIGKQFGVDLLPIAYFDTQLNPLSLYNLQNNDSLIGFTEGNFGFEYIDPPDDTCLFLTHLDYGFAILIEYDRWWDYKFDFGEETIASINNALVEADVMYVKDNAPTVHTVTFKDDDGTIIDEIAVEDGQTVTPPADPVRPGYIFTGWASGVDAEGRRTHANMIANPVTSDKTYTAVYVAGTWTRPMDIYEATLDTPIHEVQFNRTLALRDYLSGSSTEKNIIVFEDGAKITYWIPDGGAVGDVELRYYPVGGEMGILLAEDRTEPFVDRTWRFSKFDFGGKVIASIPEPEALRFFLLPYGDVVFKDHDGVTLSTQTPDANFKVQPPADPAPRPGYIFTGWGRYSEGGAPAGNFDFVHALRSDTVLAPSYIAGTSSRVAQSNDVLRWVQFDRTLSLRSYFTPTVAEKDAIIFTDGAKIAYAVSDYGGTGDVDLIYYPGGEDPVRVIASDRTAPDVALSWNFNRFNFGGKAIASVPEPNILQFLLIPCFDVAFEDYDGAPLGTVQAPAGGAAVAPTAPTRTGYTFRGWSVGLEIIDADTVAVAMYDPACLVRFYSWDNTTLLASMFVDIGGAATPPTAPVRTGYTFTSWDKPFANVTADVDIYAVYAINVYTVVFANYNGVAIDTQQVDHGGAAEAPADPSRPEHIFIGWDKDFDNITADLTVTAKFALNAYTVVFVDHDGTVLKTQQVPYSGAATAPDAPTREGYTFKGWDNDFDNINADLTIKAQYTKNSDPLPDLSGLLSSSAFTLIAGVVVVLLAIRFIRGR